MDIKIRLMSFLSDTFIVYTTQLLIQVHLTPLKLETFINKINNEIK